MTRAPLPRIDGLGDRARTRLVDEVTERLRELILSDQLQPRQQLRQTELAELLGVSRTPLRESFRVLEGEGLLRASSASKTVEVVEYSAEEMIKYYEVREVIDGLAARLLAQRGISDAELKELRGYLAEMKRSTRPYNPARHVAAHAAFHSRIVESCGNARVAALSGMIRLTAQMAARRIRAAIEQKADASMRDEFTALLGLGYEDHSAILEAIADGDARQAEVIARRHLRRTRKGPIVTDVRLEEIVR